jgi:hypothetical protein
MHPAIALAKELKDEKLKEQRLARIEELEDRVCETAAGVIEAALSFYEVTPNQQEPPPEWIALYGEKGAHQRLAVAKSGWLPQNLAPSATKLASYIYTGITRARGHKTTLSARVVNVKIALPAPTSAAHPDPVIAALPEKEIE